jgi:RNA polymerase sigma factor for flagellar operon FliA
MTPTERNALVEKHLNIPGHFARKIFARCRNTIHVIISFEDLYQAGVVGLIDAADNFDPSRGVSFGTFASSRVHGEIMDYLRKEDFLTRGHRRKVEQRDSASWAVASGIADDQQREQASHHYPKNTSISSPDGQSTLSIPENKAQLAMSPEEADAVAKLLAGLNRQERFLVKCYYLEGMSMIELSSSAGVSESRISQILMNVRERLRSKLSAAA